MSDGHGVQKYDHPATFALARETDRVLATRARGEFAFKAAGREIGHLHGDHAAHFGFPTDIWSALFDEGRIDYHPVFPGRAGFGARRIETEVDVDQVIAIMRINYDA